MEDREDKETVMEPLRQIGIAIALVVVLYGIMLILDSLFNILGAYIGHYLWLFYQIVVAILIIFVGAKLYVIAKTIKVVDLKRMARSFQKEKASLQALIVPPAFLITLFLLAGLLPLHSGNIISGVVQADIPAFPSNEEDFVGYHSYDPQTTMTTINIGSVNVENVFSKAEQLGFIARIDLNPPIMGTPYGPMRVEAIIKVGIYGDLSLHWNGTHTWISWRWVDKAWLNETLRAIFDISNQELREILSGPLDILNKEPKWAIVEQYLGPTTGEHAIQPGMIVQRHVNGNFIYSADTVTVHSRVRARISIGVESVVLDFITKIDAKGYISLEVNTTYKLLQGSIKNSFKLIFKALGLPHREN